MKIGPQAHRSSAISSSTEEAILVRGRDLCRDLMGRITFTDHVWLLVTGDLPTPNQRAVLDATLVAIAEHGLVPSVQVSRMTLAAAPEALQGAVAAGILGCGSVILGAAEAAGRLLADVVARAAESPSLDEAARAAARELVAAKRPVPGYGHPLHKARDPRAERLLEIAAQAGSAARHVEAARAIARALPELTGKPLAMNVSGAIPAVLLDAGYPLLALKGVPILARTASLIAHLLEEQERPIGFVLSDAAASAISFSGPSKGPAPRDGSRRAKPVGTRAIFGSPAPMTPVLAGIRVVEQGTFITGPCTGMMLADLGADVVKVESPTGDPYRSYQGGVYSPHFQAYNRNKRSVALDLHSHGDQALFDDLVREADVYIQNFRPGTADRLGASAARLLELNPRLVYCAISGFGADGPYVDRPSYDSVAQALSGFLSVVVDPERPRFLGPALADAVTGMYAAQGVLGALVERGHTGRGRRIEVSMLEAMAHFAIEPFAAWFALGEVPCASDRPRLAQAFILHTADGGLIAIHLSSLEKFWQGLTSALEAPELAADERFRTRQGRIENYDALNAALDALFWQRPAQHWVERLRDHDVPFAPIHSIDEVVADPQVRHLGLIVPVEGAHGDGTQAVRPAIQFDGERAGEVRAAPLLDEHGPAIREAMASARRWPDRYPPPLAARRHLP